MAQPSPNFASAKTETEVAVLQVQYNHLSEKVEEVKTGLKDLATHIDTHMEETHNLIENSKKKIKLNMQKSKRK